MLAGALLLYVVSAAPGPLWQDSGMIHTRVMLYDLHGRYGLALSHPLYYLFAFAVRVFPLGDTAYKVNLLSAVFGAITVANVYLVVRLWTGRSGPALVGALSLAVGHTFWRHCAIAETYTLVAALLSTELVCLLCYFRSGRGGWLAGLALANGLGISNHMMAVLCVPVWLVLLVWLRVGVRVSGRTLRYAAGAWLAGASILGALIVEALVRGAAPLDVVQSALFGNVYAKNVANVHLSLPLVKRSLLYMGLNYPTPIFLLVFIGIGPLRRVWPRPVAVCVAVLAGIFLVWAVRYDVPDQYGFFIPAYVLFALLIGQGADVLMRRGGRAVAAGLIVLALLPPAVYWILPDVARRAGLDIGSRSELPFRDPYRFFLQPWKTGENGPSRFAQACDDLTTPDDLLLIWSTVVRPIHYRMLTGRWDGARVLPELPTVPDAGRVNPTSEELESTWQRGHVYVLTPAWLQRFPGGADAYRVEPADVLYRVLPVAAGPGADSAPQEPAADRR